MSNDVTNADLLKVLGDIREDIGGLKTSTTLQLKALENHSTRIGALEEGVARQKGAVKVWGVIATAAASVVGGAVPILVKFFKH